MGLAAIHGQAGVNPGLRAAFNKDAALHTRPLQFFDGAAGASAGLAKHINRRAITAPLAAEGGGIEFIEREELRAGDVGGGVLAGRPNVEQPSRRQSGAAIRAG